MGEKQQKAVSEGCYFFSTIAIKKKAGGKIENQINKISMTFKMTGGRSGTKDVNGFLSS